MPIYKGKMISDEEAQKMTPKKSNKKAAKKTVKKAAKKRITKKAVKKARTRKPPVPDLSKKTAKKPAPTVSNRISKKRKPVEVPKSCPGCKYRGITYAKGNPNREKNRHCYIFPKCPANTCNRMIPKPRRK